MATDTTQSKYRKTDKSTDQPSIQDNEVRITTKGRVKKYVDYSLRLLQGAFNKDGNYSKAKEATDKEKKEEEHTQKFDTIMLKATGMAINKAVTTAEVVKRRVGGLHQVTDLKTLEIEDTWEPLEEGLKTVKTTRRVASITIKLSCDPEEIKKMESAVGYQEPTTAESIKPGTGRRRGGVRGRRGGQGGGRRDGNQGGGRRDGNQGGGNPQGGRQFFRGGGNRAGGYNDNRRRSPGGGRGRGWGFNNRGGGGRNYY